MKGFPEKGIELLGLLWFVAVVVVITLSYAPSALNADILMNSVMSLQKITLYYWGQNRLLNVLPFLVSPIRDPLSNLWAVLFVSSAIFVGLLALMAQYVVKIMGGEKNDVIAVFVILSSVVLLVMRPYGLSEMALGHVEYSLSMLCAGLASYMLWYGKGARSIRFSGSGLLLIISLGLNPSTLVVILFVVCGVVFFKHRIGREGLFVAVSSVLFFAFWVVVAKWHGGSSYDSFAFGQIVEGLGVVTVSMLKMTNVVACFSLLLVWTFWKILLLSGTDRDLSDPVFLRQRLVIQLLFIFSIVWMFLFVSHKWVSMNLYAVRYFIYVFFALMVVVGFEIYLFVDKAPSFLGRAFTVSIALVAVVSVYKDPVPMRSFDVFKRVEQVVPQSHGLYAGDYWLVWPTVMRDMIEGKEAYGLANRGEANREKATAYIDQEQRSKGVFSVLCLNAQKDHCLKQIEIIAGSVELVCEVELGEGASQLLLKMRHTEDRFPE